MNFTDYPGIDYSRGCGLTPGGPPVNRDPETGIRYGVIPCHAVDYWWESAEANYGDPTCPDCGSDLVDPDDTDLDTLGGVDWVCHGCRLGFDSDECYPEEAFSHYVDTPELAAETSDCVDIFVCRSEYYTYAQYCSPCAPGACYLTSPLGPGARHSGNRAYCFGPDWFDGPPPYPIWRVSDDREITQ